MSYNFVLEEATKQSTPPLISLWGQSGTGKTLSALKLARGIVGDNGKIVLIDTENKRAKFYADKGGKWFHVDLQPPFTPDKYSAAFKFAEDKGADIIIVDSMSHVWEGEGGVLDMADNGKSAKGYELKGLAKWKKPKTEYKRMINKLLRAPIPVIFCIRAKEKFVQDGGDTLKSEGLTPIMDKNFVYEMTVSLKMEENGRFAPIGKNLSKIPEFLLAAMPIGVQVNEKMGQEIIKSLGKLDHKQKESINLLRDGTDAATQGGSVWVAWWEKLTPEQKQSCSPYVDQWKIDSENIDVMPHDETIGIIEDLIKSTNTDKKKFLEYFKVSEVDDLTSEQKQKAVELLKKKGK